MLKYKVLDNNYQTVKQVLISHFQISNRLLSRLKNEQRIFLNREKVYVTAQIHLNDIIEVDIDFEEESENILPKEMDLNIIFEDEYLLMINKPYNLPVHPSILHYEDSLSNGIAYYFKGKNIKRKIRPVNRLDKDTSGIVIFAKNEYVQESLIRQMKQNDYIKKYIAILEGHLENNTGTINAPIARKENSIIEREISINGDYSVTHYNLIKKFEIGNQKLSLVEFTLKTGRTHQIRVHSKHIGHPILGDSLYGNTSNLISRQALHAYKVSFIHPISHNNLTLEIDLSEDMKEILNKF